MPRTSRSAGPEKATKKKAATKAAPARAGKAASTGTTKAAAPAKAAAKATPSKASSSSSSNKAPAPAKAAKAAKGGPADKFLEAQHKALLEERETYTRHASERRAEAEQLAADREPGDVQFDEESGEGDSIGMERERDLQLAGQARATVEEIDRALAKIDAGTYGICERCGQPIPKARLKVLPYAALCVACKSGGLTSRR